MKICNTCNESKDFSKFSKNIRSADGHNYRCKACQSAYYKGYNVARKSAEATTVPQSKTCLDCHLEKPISQFGKKSNVPDKHNIYCKPCWRIRCYKNMRKSGR